MKKRSIDIKYCEIIDNLHEGIAVTTLDYKFIFANPSVEKLFGARQGELIGRSLRDYIDETDYYKVRAKIEEGWKDKTDDFDILVKSKSAKSNDFDTNDDGKIINVTISYYNTKKEKILLLGVYRDVTQQKQLEEKINQITFHDSLTGLYNRAYYEEELNRLDTKRQLPISIIMTDVNNLKLINDIYGHDVGDELLKSISQALKKSCRKEDIIARIGGDEFIILLPGMGEEKAREIENRILKEIKKINIKDLPASAACGRATKYHQWEKTIEVFKKAEDMMYSSKINKRQLDKSNLLKALFKKLRKDSYETKKHTGRMGSMAFKLGTKLGLNEYDMVRLMNLISLHDIGKVIVPAKILKKKGELTLAEWEKITKHPEAGYRIALLMEKYMNIAEELLAHHEWFDGRGYPRGIKDEEIPLLSRILAIVEAYDVIIEGRPYYNGKQSAVTSKEALSKIKENAGTQFDPELIRLFASITEKELQKKI